MWNLAHAEHIHLISWSHFFKNRQKNKPYPWELTYEEPSKYMNLQQRGLPIQQLYTGASFSNFNPFPPLIIITYPKNHFSKIIVGISNAHLLPVRSPTVNHIDGLTISTTFQLLSASVKSAWSSKVGHCVVWNAQNSRVK